MSENILRRVSKLLALSADNPSEHEAQAAAVKAQELMLGEAITMADVAQWETENGTRTVKLEAGHVEYHCDTGSYKTASWRASLAWHVAEYMGGKAVRTPSSGVKSRGTYVLGKMTFVGLNVDTIVEVYRYLELQLDLLSTQETKDRPFVDRYNYRTGEYESVRPNARYWRLSWLVGAESRLEEILKEQYQKAEATSGTELVLVKDIVKDKMHELFGRLRDSRASQKVYDGNAHARGRVAADSIDVGRSKLHAPPAQIGA